MATLSPAAKNAALDAITAILDANGGGRIRLRTAGSVTLMDTALFGSAPRWGVAAGGSVSANALPDTRAFTGTGTVAQYILDSGAGTAVIFNISGTGVGDVGSGAEMEMNVRAVVTGQILRINTLTLSLP
jgi:hypothetical protein